MTNTNRILALIMVVVTSHSVGAIYPVRSVEEQLESSTLVVSGVVSGQRSYWNADHSYILTDVTLDVVDVAKGAADNTVSFYHIGGTVGVDVAGISGGVDFETGERVIVFLNEDSRGRLTISGFQDKYTIGDALSVYPDTFNEVSRRINEVLGSDKLPESRSASAKALAVSFTSVKPAAEFGVDPWGYIEIAGSGFGTSGTRKVRFRKDIEATPASWDEFSLSTDPNLYDTWTSSLIKFWPAGPEAGSPTPMDIHDISSGPVQVYTGGSWSSSSSDELDIKYTYSGWKWSSAKAANGIEFWLNVDTYPATYDTTTFRQKIEAALDSWANVTGADLDFVVKGYTSTTDSQSDAPIGHNRRFRPERALHKLNEKTAGSVRLPAA